MRICITGASGFLGTWTSQVLSVEHEVFAITRKQSSVEKIESNPRINIISKEVKSWAGSINEIAPDVLIMHDWQGVGNSDRNSEVQYSNVERIKALFRELKPIQAVIGVGSQAELGPRNNEILEDDVSAPTSDYGRAKCEVRNLLMNHFQYSDTNFKWARIFSTYGAMDNGNWLIPNLVRSLRINEPFPLTEGTQEWNYLHGFDAGEAFKFLATFGDPGIYNIGHSKTSIIRDVCMEIATIMGKSAELLKFGEIPMRPDQVHKLLISTTKLQELGWSPKVDLSQGLMHTVDWICEEKFSPIALNDGTNVLIDNFSI